MYLVLRKLKKAEANSSISPFENLSNRFYSAYYTENLATIAEDLSQENLDVRVYNLNTVEQIKSVEMKAVS